MFALVRPATRRASRGISFILIDVKNAGITTRPIDHRRRSRVNQVFFDNVRVPVTKPCRRGRQGLDLRQVSARIRARLRLASAKLREALRTVSDLAESEATGCAIDDPDIALRMSEIEVDIDTLEMTERACCRRCRPDKIRARCHRC
jgi:acyl-CoA dehydrogenase